jgi:small acid-soluble spore protein H (minor)
MDAKRAQEISSLPSMVSVSYNGQPVYIEHVDQSNGQVTIHPLNEPTSKQSVSVTDLTEQ